MQASSSSPSGLPDQFFPPAQEGRRSALLLALLAHALLLLGLALATRWNPAPTTLSVQAELWSALPQQMGAPSAPEPALSDPQPQPQPEPRPAPQPEPQPSSASKAQVAPELQAAQIALEKEKKKRLAEQAEREKLEREKAAREKEKRAADEKRKQEQAEKERADKARAEQAKAEKDKAAKDKAAQEAKQAQERENERRETLRRLQNLAGSSSGASGSGASGSGAEARSSGPSASYAGRIVARVKPNLVFTQTLAGNPRAEVLVRLSPSGTILSRRLVTSSGNKAWDEAVLKAIDKTETFPRDTDGRVPEEITLGFRPQD